MVQRHWRAERRRAFVKAQLVFKIHAIMKNVAEQVEAASLFASASRMFRKCCAVCSANSP